MIRQQVEAPGGIDAGDGAVGASTSMATTTNDVMARGGIGSYEALATGSGAADVSGEVSADTGVL